MVSISKESGVRRFINASTCSVYGVSNFECYLRPPVRSDHGLNKYEGFCESILLKYQSTDFTTVVIRPATVCGYSPRQRLDLNVHCLTDLAKHSY